jgi:hypothetical protein
LLTFPEAGVCRIAALYGEPSGFFSSRLMLGSRKRSPNH